MNPSSDQWQAFSEGLSHALDLSGSERVPWLRELAGRDSELAAAIVRALAARAHEEFSAFLAEPLVIPAEVAVGASLIARLKWPW